MAVDPARAKSLFLAASDLADPAARVAFLNDACGDDAALRLRVEALLGADGGGVPPAEGKTEGAFEPSPPQATEAGDPGVPLPPELEATEAGCIAPGPDTPREVCAVGFVSGQVLAGRYTLLDVLGQGGMGTVYRAVQTAPVRREVALKLIRVGMDSRAVLARFDAERQALALMDHPNIARVFDGGTTETGQPFFVMELVRGEPITDYCDRVRLPLRTRLELFVSVCQAVQHAHQKGVIHRDLKPSNVIVTEVDGRATPKVIDFGVATATEFDLTDQSLTDAGAIVGTPTYMSPEQADPSTTDVDTRTDVYALGVMLYELLAGSPPLDAKQFKRGALMEMLRMVREVDPPRPSTKVSTADALPSIAASRAAEPAHLKRALRGDLDWIVMMALEKDRRRRYATANGFAADILRHLSHEPVAAAPPSRAYRLRKFVRKHRGPVTAAGLIALVLLAGIVGTTWGLFRAKRQEAVALHYADEAGAQAKVARDNAKRADLAAVAARKAERVAEDRAAAEAAAKTLAQRETERAEAERKRTEVQLARAEWLLYAGKVAQAQHDFEAGNGGLALHYLNECQTNLRGWEHRYLWSRVNARQTLVGRAGSVLAVAFSADGRRIVTGNGDGSAKLWDAQTGQETRTLRGHANEVHAVAVSPDGTRVATAGLDGTAKLWDAATGQELRTLERHTTPVLGVAFSPDGKRVATCTGVWANVPDPVNEVRVWDAGTGRDVLAIKGLDCRVFGLAFSPDGRRLVAGLNDGTGRVWDAESGREVLALKGHVGGVLSVAFSRDGKRLLSSGEDQTVRVWDAADGRELLSLSGHRDFVPGAAFSPDGSHIVSGSYDQTVRVWDAATGKRRLTLKGHAGIVRGVAFSPDGKRIVTGSDDGTARVWDAEKGQEVSSLTGHGDFVKGIAYSPDGRRILTGSGDGTAKLWDAATGREVLTFRGHTAPTVAVAYGPDGRRVASTSKDRTARLWDAATGREVLALKGHHDEVWCVAFSPDGKRVATGCSDGTAKVWDAVTGREVLALKGQPGVVWCLAFSPDGRHVATGCSDGTARVWDAATGREVLSLPGQTGGVLGVAYSPDGGRIVTGVFDNTVRVWDAATGREALTLKGHTAAVWGVTYSPDGRRIASGSADRSVKLWDAATGQEVLALKGQANEVLCVAFSPDGRHLASGVAGIFSAVRVWSAEKGQDVLLLEGPTDLVTSVAFSDDGRRVFAWDAGMKVLAWSAADGKPVPPVDPPPQPPPGPARSPDGFRHATPQGKTVAVTDERPSPSDNAWPLPAAGPR